MKKFNPCLSVLVMVLLLLPASMFAQSFKVSGTVSDQTGGIVGASVLVKGTTTGISTDLDGHYTITVPNSESVLVYSYIGYKTKEVAVSPAMTTVNVTLEEDAQTMQDVVVLGFGAATRKADLSTSVGVVSNMEENKNRPISSVENLLQGQVAGVTVVSNGGDPTATPSVTIRGMGSQSNENVLWVVDGVPGAPFSINDIESMVVLKDAASAAIYGAQSGAAGVILVTTKKAKSGAPSVTYEGNFGVRSAYNKPQSLTVEEERWVRTKSLAAADKEISELWSVTNPEMSATRTNWIDEVFRNAFYQRHQVAVSGGTDKFASRVAFNYNDDQGTLMGTFNKTASIRFNGSYDITRHISISEDAYWSSNKQRGQTTGINTDEGYTGIIWSAMSMPRSARAFYDDGSYGGTAERGSDVAGLHGDVVNPIRLLMANTTINKTQKFSTTTALNIHNILPGLKFNSRFTYRTENFFYKNFSPKITEPGKPNANNRLDYETYDAYFWETENTLTYDNTFGKHTVGALIATTASEQRQRGFAVAARNFDSEAEADQYLSYASDFKLNPTDSYANPDNNVAIVARLSYSFDNRYFVTASWRRDYAGRLPKGNKSGDFPAVTGAWKISSEPFFKQNDVVTLLKLRASWGRVGNLGSIGYAYGYPTLSRDGNGDGTQVGGQTLTNLLYLKSAINPNLSWETSEQTDIGLDIDMFSSRLSISADYFTKRTFDLIQTQTAGWPDYIGIGAQLVNQGEIRNRGFELSATWKEQVNKDWSYYVSGNFATLKNWVSDIGVMTASGDKGVWTHTNHFRSSLKPYQTAEGMPLYTYYLVQTGGLFQSDEEAANYTWTNPNTGEVKRIQPNAKAGDIKFIDANGDGKIDTDDKVYMSSYQPKLTYSFSAGFTWKNLTFSMMWQGAAKTKAFNATKFTYLNEAQGVFNRSVDILKAWPATNDVPRLTSADANGNFATESDFYLEDASYLRLKNVTISYDLSSLVRKSARLASRGSALSVFVSGENLWTITNYTGLDPEVGGLGLDAGRYPVSRVFSIGVKLTY